MMLVIQNKLLRLLTNLYHRKLPTLQATSALDLQYQLLKFIQKKVLSKFLQLQQIRLLRMKVDQTYLEFAVEMTNKVKLLVIF